MIEKKEIFKLLENVISRTSDLEEQKYLLMDIIIHYFSESQDFTKIAQKICSDFKMELPEQIKSEIEKQKEVEAAKKLNSANQKLSELQKEISKIKPQPAEAPWIPVYPTSPTPTIPDYGKFKKTGPYWVNPNDDNDFKYTVTCDVDTDKNLNNNYYKYQQFVADEKFKLYKNGVPDCGN